MREQIVITDLTRMEPPNVCIAGYTRDWTCRRPIVPRRGIPEWFLHRDGQLVIRPFAVVELDFVRALPEAPHSEDWEIDRFHRQLIVPQLDVERRVKLLERTASRAVADIFGTQIHSDLGFYVRAGEGERSLGTTRPARLLEVIYEPKEGQKWDYRIVFEDQAAQRYRLRVTDLAFRCYLDHCHTQLGQSPEAICDRLLQLFNQASTFLRIGLARYWDRFPDRCYLQITGVYSFPDYLEGRCFADFRREP